MHYKNFFSATALVTLLSLPNAAFSDLVSSVDNEETSYYVRMQYNGEFLPLKTKIDAPQYTNDNYKDKTFSPFKISLVSGSAAFGYKMDDIRVDIEGLYSQLKKNEVLGAVTKKENVEITDDLSVISGLINVYYDISIDDMPVTPYIGVGVGTAYLSNPLKNPLGDKKSGFGFAYQAKAGVSYDVSPEIKLYAGARYFGSYGASFDRQEDYTVPTTTSSGDTLTRKVVNGGGSYKILYSTIGAEAGVTFNF